MNDFTLVGEIPKHQYVFIDSSYIYKSCNSGFIPAVWYGLVSLRGRVWGCTIMLECGAIYRNLPPNSISFIENPEPNWTLKDSQRWDCYGERFTCIEYEFLNSLEVKVIYDNKQLGGQYLFTVAPIKDAFSMFPEQAKEFKFIKLDNGRLTIQPTNFLLFKDASFTTNDSFEIPKGLKCQSEIYTCER